jgi:chemotaxis protein MotB
MKEERIIIKKVKVKGHGGHHGGEWKVAYSDFITAMMAFFLLMWLIAILSPEKKQTMAQYFKDFSFLQQGGAGFLDRESGISGGSGSDKSNIASQIPKGGPNLLTREELRDKLKKDVENKLAEVKDQVLIDIFEGGVRIQMVDKDGNPMFALGSSVPTETAKKIIRAISKTIKDQSNSVAVEGHTDGLNYSTSRYTNWELSTERASAARKELESEGLNPDRLVRVAGYASKELLIRENPNDPRNRRISIILLFGQAKDGRPHPGNGLPAELIGNHKNSNSLSNLKPQASGGTDKT